MINTERYLRTGDAAGAPFPDDGHGHFIGRRAEAEIDTQLAAASPIRKLSSVVRTMSPVGGGELYAMPAAPQSSLDDLDDVGRWLAKEVRDVFAAQETRAFVNGDGVNKPTGFLNDPGRFDRVTATADIGVDALLCLINFLHPRVRRGGTFLCNRRTLSTLSKLKDADDQYIVKPGTGGEHELLGYPLIEIEDMPDAAPGQFPIAFGNFFLGYQIADRQGVRVLRDPYSAKPYVLFYTTKQINGGVRNPDAIALIEVLKP